MRLYFCLKIHQHGFGGLLFPPSLEVIPGLVVQFKKKLEILAEPNASPPGALRPIGGTIEGAHILLVAKSRGQNSNALEYAERAVST